MNRYDWQYRHLQASLPPPHNVSARIKQELAELALIQHRGNGFDPIDDEAIVQQFDFRDLREYWECALSEPKDADIFAHLLAKHFFLARHRNDPHPHIMAALRVARIENERWFIEDLVRPPTSREDISRLKVYPRAAAEWMLSKPKRRHLVPPSLARYLARGTEEIATTSPVLLSTGAPGRPTSMHLVKAKLKERGDRRENLPTCKAEAEWLSVWLTREHPGNPPVLPKTLQNTIAEQYRAIPKSIPK